MADPRTDRIAREAARLIQLGRSPDLAHAIHLAADSLKLANAPLPSHARVRKHAQAMSMQAMGEAAYNEARLDVWRIAEQIMTVFEHTMPEATTLLVGRAAQAHIDAGLTIHIRLYSRASITAVADALQQFGYDDLAFETAETRFGRLSQVRFIEGEHDVAITRCLPDMLASASADLFTANHIDTLDLTALRRKLGAAESHDFT